MKDLLQRFLVNGISTIIIAVLIFFAEIPAMKWIFTAAISIVLSVALWEYFQIIKKKQLTPSILLGLGFGVAFIWATFAKTQGPYSSTYLNHIFDNLPSIILGLLLLALFLYYFLNFKSPIFNIATTFFGVVYIAVPLALIIRIIYFFNYEQREDLHFEGIWWTVYLIAVTKIADMGGYFIGKTWGKNKLAPSLSPNKTVEGFVGGLIASILLSIFLCFLGKKAGAFEQFSYFQSIWLGFFVGFLGQIGDLAESLLKRDAKVKDSNTIPGVGGVLDMIDSLLFTAPVVYIFLRIFYT